MAKNIPRRYSIHITFHSNFTRNVPNVKFQTTSLSQFGK